MDFARCFPAIHFRHGEIRKHDIEFLGTESFETRATTIHSHHAVFEISKHLADPAIQLFVATRATGKKQAHLAGWYELRRVADDDSVEIAYFGIVATEFGRGFGKHLLSSAVGEAWALGPQRVWLHTCTLDHPNALPNYLARGFTPYRTETYEVDSNS